MQTVFKASWSAASSTVSKPKAWEKPVVSECLEYLSDYKLLSMHFCTIPTLKTQSGLYLSASSIFTISRQRSPDLTAQRNILIISCYSSWSEIPEIPNQTLQVKRWLKEPAKLSEFDSLIYMSFHEQTLLESRSQTCDGSTCYFAADLSKDWQQENNQQHKQYVSICIHQESETHSTHECLFHQE